MTTAAGHQTQQQQEGQHCCARPCPGLAALKGWGPAVCCCCHQLWVPLLLLLQVQGQMLLLLLLLLLLHVHLLCELPGCHCCLPVQRPLLNY